jgi:sterol desaturase/sphingolipid hydroxylase (fatty acid hydroxylase superfamily)
MPTPDTPLLLALGLPLGIVLWSFMEYVLHRFAFHEARGRNYGSREHLRHHGSEDTVLESWYLSWAGVLLVSLGLLPFLGRLAGQPDLGWGIGIGYLVAYGFYDLVHWRAHRRPYANRYEHMVRKHHFIHHFHAPLKNHGVTTPFWDHVFGTYVDVDVVRVPRRMAMRWMVDEHGEVLPEYRGTYELRGTRPLDDDQREQDRELAFANQAPTL